MSEANKTSKEEMIAKPRPSLWHQAIASAGLGMEQIWFGSFHENCNRSLDDSVFQHFYFLKHWY